MIGSQSGNPDSATECSVGQLCSVDMLKTQNSVKAAVKGRQFKIWTRTETVKEQIPAVRIFAAGPGDVPRESARPYVMGKRRLQDPGDRCVEFFTQGLQLAT